MITFKLGLTIGLAVGSIGAALVVRKNRDGANALVAWVKSKFKKG